jgi:hypothetical protein
LTEPLDHLPLIDIHSVAVKAAPEMTFDAVQLQFAGLLSGPVGRLMSRLLECDPPAAFEVLEAQRPNLVVLAGKHRFSRYGIVFRISPTETGCTLSAERHTQVVAWTLRMGKTRSLALIGAAAWSCALIVGAFVVPAYSSDSSTGTGSATLVGENGAGIVIPILIPLIIVLAASAALWRDHRSAAWTATGLLAAFNVLALLSIGIFVLPITICLVVACLNGKEATSTATYPQPS